MQVLPSLPVPLEAPPGVGRVAAPAQSVNPNHQKLCLFSVKMDGWMKDEHGHVFSTTCSLIKMSICLKTFACSPCIGPKRPVQESVVDLEDAKPWPMNQARILGGLYLPFLLNLLIVD